MAEHSYELKRVDPVLDMSKGGNLYVTVNKGVQDMLRTKVRAVNEIKDTFKWLLDTQHNEHTELGSLDILSAYSQIWLPEELRNYTAF